MKEYEEGRDGLQDLNQLLGAMGGRASSVPTTKGSRFTHTQKLQFAQVSLFSDLYPNNFKVLKFVSAIL
jgi:hypothetical protein